MKKYLLSFLFLLLLSTSGAKHPLLSTPEAVTEFHVNLNDRAEDLFKVTVHVHNLDKKNSYFQFAATAPGTYQIMDIGRYVHSFKAFDKNKNEIACTRLSTNRWEFSQPEKVAHIEYAIAETWDTPVDSNRIYRMCGTSLEADHAVINSQAVFGYIAGMQSNAIRIKLNYPEEWLVGTALLQNEEGYFVAHSYDHLVDSPFQLGKMTRAATTIDNTKIEVYSYSKTGLVTAEKILSAMQEMLEAAEAFLGHLPVERYTFLYHFEDASHGAWEHSYSSSYVYQERDFEDLKERILKTSAHEFFHIITPLNIHSEIIEHFNFSEPTPSQHLWLYEGTTEWAAQIMLLRGNLRTPEDYFSVLRRKIAVDKMYYRSDYSLTDIAANSYSRNGARQYGNVYMRGAVVSGLLDILLLDLSDGEKGWRDVLLELTSDYGPSKPFDEAQFFNEITRRTYPQIKEFIDKFIVGSEPLPIASYFNKIGITYFEQKNIVNEDLGIGVEDGEFFIAKVPDGLGNIGIQKNDKLIKINNKEINSTSMRRLRYKFEKETENTTYKLELRRDGERITVESADSAFINFIKSIVLNFRDLSKESLYVFELNPNANQRQKRLRERWLKN